MNHKLLYRENKAKGSVYVTFRPPVSLRDQVEILRNCLTEKAITELMAVLGRTNRTKFRDQVLKPLIEDRLLEMTIPDKPRSSKQKYRLTEKGRKIVQSLESNAQGQDR